MFIFCGDEMGHGGPQGGGQKALVVAGILVNTYSAGKTRREFAQLLTRLGDIAGKPIQELKGQALFRGSGEWSGVLPGKRAQARSAILDWLTDRGHKIVASGVVYGRLQEAFARCSSLREVRPRVLATLHVSLAIQRTHFRRGRREQNKNATLLFFDRQDGQDERDVARLIEDPPDWALEFLADNTEGQSMSAIVGTAYFVDSTQAPMIQVGDFVSFILHRKAAIEAGSRETFQGEAQLDGVFAQLRSSLVDRRYRLPQRPRSALGEALEILSPEFLRE